EVLWSAYGVLLIDTDKLRHHTVVRASESASQFLGCRRAVYPVGQIKRTRQLPDPKPSNVRAHRDHLARAVGYRHERRLDGSVVVAASYREIAVVEAERAHAQHDFVRTGRRLLTGHGRKRIEAAFSGIDVGFHCEVHPMLDAECTLCRVRKMRQLNLMQSKYAYLS